MKRIERVVFFVGVRNSVATPSLRAARCYANVRANRDEGCPRRDTPTDFIRGRQEATNQDGQIFRVLKQVKASQRP